MKKNLTELVFILDRSGSMGGLEQDTIGGLENASKRFSYEKIRRMIEREKEQYGWEFLFLGANMDAVQEAHLLSVPIIIIAARTGNKSTPCTAPPDVIG